MLLAEEIQKKWSPVLDHADLEPIKEHINLVKDDLREQYFRGEIFNEGDIVESSDVVYKIIKRGSNHLLLQNEEGLKVSKWIQDVQLTERKFMLSFKQLLEGEHDTSAVAAKNRGVQAANPAMQKAQVQSKAAQLAADEAEAKLKLQKEFERKKEALKTEAVESPVVDKNSKYNLAKSVMSLSDFRKSMGQVKPKEESPDQKNIADKIEDEMEGNTHVAPSIDALKRMKIKHHLGEESEQVEESLADQILAAAKAKGLNAKIAPPLEDRKKATAKLIKHRAKERAKNPTPAYMPPQKTGFRSGAEDDTYGT